VEKPVPEARGVPVTLTGLSMKIEGSLPPSGCHDAGSTGYEPCQSCNFPPPNTVQCSVTRDWKEQQAGVRLSTQRFPAGGLYPSGD